MSASNGGTAHRIDIGDDNFCAFGSKAQRDRAAEAGAGPGDERHLAGKPAHAAPSSRSIGMVSSTSAAIRPRKYRYWPESSASLVSTKDVGVGEHARQNPVFANVRIRCVVNYSSRDFSLQSVTLLSLVLPAAGFVIEFRQFAAFADDHRHPDIGTFLDARADGIRAIARWPRRRRPAWSANATRTSISVLPSALV